MAAWPAASLVGSCELLLWLIRTASGSAAARVSLPDQTRVAADHHAADLRAVAASATATPVVTGGRGDPMKPEWFGSDTALTSGPVTAAADEACQTADHAATRRDAATGQHADRDDLEEKVNAAAVAAYRASIDNGKPISERRLAAMFGKTSRRWARHRVAEARHTPLTVAADAA